MRIANGLFNQSLADLLIDAVESETNFLSHISQSQQTREIVLSLVYDHQNCQNQEPHLKSIPLSCFLTVEAVTEIH
jgi:hypothetical protein